MIFVEDKISGRWRALAFIALWLTYSFKNAFATGMALRMMPYITSGLAFNVALADSPVLIGFSYVLSGLIWAAISYFISVFIFSFFSRRLSQVAAISRNDFITIVCFSTSIANLIAGGVLWFSFLNPLLFALATSVLNIAVYAAVYVGTFLWLYKKEHIPAAGAPSLYLLLSAVFWGYHLANFLMNTAGGLI
ncbi:MAG TPA: hypothetical protein P5161_00935 [Eubacteriales bacterium]|jgi:hypothetical protein|nr:hypothetical protein [Clostridia bacterium]HRR89334.1 hypothetical protein [Eubacteriales bacterium]HRU84934.1 hypothetical protein [Eubacteriales bacterium]